MTWPLRGVPLALAAILVAGVGAVTAVASVAVHNKSWPWLVLAAAAPVSAAVAARAGWLRLGFGLGWLGLLFVMLQPRPEGDYLIAATPRGYVLLATGLALMVFIIVTLPVRRRAVESGSTAPGT